MWPLILALDRLPWPWGEEILAHLFAAKAFARPRQLGAALAWARAHGRSGSARWRLALACCAYRGRFVARSALLGMRTPADLVRHLVLAGEEHLTGPRGARLLLGFHLGPGPFMALRAAGHRVTWVGGAPASPGLSREAWQAIREPGDVLSLSGGADAWGGVLYRARQRLAAGGTVLILADGGAGREAFRVPLPGGPICVRAGWLALRRLSGVPVLPVLSHLDGLTQVIAIHPPLPPPAADAAADLEACRAALAPLLERHARRFPAQCYSLVFRPPPEADLLAVSLRG